MASVRTGLDVLIAERFHRLKGRRVGVLAHAGSISGSYLHVIDVFANQTEFTFSKIFGPEHGLRGAAPYMEQVSSSVDSKTGLPVISLYGNTAESLSPKPNDFADLDVLVVDLPDVGARYYTYAQTMSLCMTVAGACGVDVLVLDRPNPIGGVDIEGALLTKGCRSFCGYTPVANRHGLTMGELARVYQAGFGGGDDHYPAIACNLDIVRMENWNRAMYFEETGVPWVLPSPNIPTVNTAVVYPGGCLFEATNISEGRGTTLPFEFIGAPYLDGDALVEAVARENMTLRGATLRSVSFLPLSDKSKGEMCGGIQIHVTNRKEFQSFRWALAIINAIRKLAPSAFAWRGGTYEFVDKVPAIDLLYGNAAFREVVEGHGNLSTLEASLTTFENTYRAERAPFLLYS